MTIANQLSNPKEVFEVLRSLPQCVEVECDTLYVDDKYVFPLKFLNALNGIVFGLALDDKTAVDGKAVGILLSAGSDLSRYPQFRKENRPSTIIKDMPALLSLLHIWRMQAIANGLVEHSDAPKTIKSLD